jgi:hypothetical protein
MSIFNAPSFYNQADQDIYNQGFSFIPQEQFRGGAFKIPGDGSVENDTFRQPIRTLLDQGGGGGNNAFNASDNPAFLGNYGDIDFNERYKFNPQEFMTDANDFGFGVADESDKGFLPSLKNKLGKGIDFGKMIGGGILSAATGIPFLGAGLNALSKNFEKRELGAGIIDEFGNFYDEDELNKQNALGGYYTDAARSARRRTSRIENMLRRQAQGKKISLANLAKLQAQEKAQEAARQAAADQMQQENRATGRGGYQAGYDSDFMDGPGDDGGSDNGGGGSPGSSGPGGSDSMGSFAYGGRVPYMMGGLTDLVDIYD